MREDLLIRRPPLRVQRRTRVSRARAVSYDANADESRWLLDPTAALQSGFFAKASQIAAVPGVDAAAAADPGAYYGGLKSAVGQLSRWIPAQTAWQG